MNSIVFLEEAYEALKTLETEKARQQTLQADLKKAEKKLDSLKKSMNDEISQTVRQKYDSISAEYERQISTCQSALRQLRLQKDSTKKLKKEDRIQEKTAPYLTKQEQLKTSLKQLFDNNRVPHICRNRLFYLLFMPVSIGAWLIDLLLVVLFFFLIPYGIALLIPPKSTLYSSLISFACVLVFGGIYLILDHTLKENHLQALKDGRKILNAIRSNKKKIRKITHSIQKDDDEEHDDDIKQHNYDIAKHEAELEQLTSDKKEALDTFNAATKKVIQNEITSRYEPSLAEQKRVISSLSEPLAESQREEAEVRRIISEKYEPYIDKDFLSSNQINALISCIRSKEANNISDAITICRNKN